MATNNTNSTLLAAGIAGQSTALGYDLNFALSIVGSVVFLLVLLHHIFLFFESKTRFLWQLILALMMQSSGFVLRAYTDHHKDEVRKFLISYILLILTPAILTIALLRTFKRLMWYITPPFRRKLSTTWVPDGILVSIFRLAYIVMMAMQWVGGSTLITSFSSPTDFSAYTRGSHMLYISFYMQAALLLLSLLITLHFQLVSRHWAPNTLLSTTPPSKPWHHLLTALSISLLLLLVRTIYRIFEFNPSTPHVRDYLHTHEFTFYVCDVLPILAVFVLLALVHPGQCITRPYTGFWFRTGQLKRKEEKVLQQSWPGSGGTSDLEMEVGGAAGRSGLQVPKSVHFFMQK